MSTSTTDPPATMHVTSLNDVFHLFCHYEDMYVYINIYNCRFCCALIYHTACWPTMRSLRERGSKRDAVNEKEEDSLH